MWIENAYLPKGWKTSHHNIVTGIPQNNWQVSLAPYVCIDMVPVDERDFALRPYGYEDAFRGSLTDEHTLYLGKPFSQWMSQRGISLDDLGRTDDLQAASLFPVCHDLDTLEYLLHWFLSDNPDSALTECWRSLPRFSADELSVHANLRRLFAQRHALQTETLPLIAKNWQRSVFYQTNLKDMAEKFAENHLPVPDSLPTDSALMTRIHDAMFRSEIFKKQIPTKHADTTNRLLPCCARD